jgi:putative ABC transport system permease protein
MKLPGWLGRWRSERQMHAEMRFHLDSLARDYQSQGLNINEAQQRAHKEFGPLELAKDECRDTMLLRWLDPLWRDIRFALRMLVKNPGFTVVAVAALALGIGADTAMYTIVVGSLSWDMGLDRRDQMAIAGSRPLADNRGIGGSSYPDFRDFRSEVKTLAGLAAYQFTPVNFSDRSGLPERYYCVEMSANGFSVVGQKPLLGRDFIAEDEKPGAPPVLILGYHVWRDRYARDAAIIGQTVRLNEVPRVVVGVMPPGRRFPEETDLWTPLVPDAAREKRDNRNLFMFGRLGDGIPFASARAELVAAARRLADQYPDTNKDMTVDVRPIMEITGLFFMKPLFYALFGAVAFVLLIASADVANMLLARAAERSREISIRVAIGAGKIPIVRQLLLESVVLSVTGGFLGWLVALGGLRWFDRGLGTLTKPVWLHLSLDRSALFYLGAISIGTGILFGLAPALRLAKTDVHAALKDGGYGTVGSKFGLGLSNTLVACQMALCVVLLAGAGLLIRSAVNLYSAPIGVNTASVLTMRVNLPEAKYAKPESQVAFHETLRNRLKALPGVEIPAIASNLPLGNWIPFSFELQGRAHDPAQPLEAGGLVVSNDYFRALEVQPKRGRVFSDVDGASGVPVAVVNETFAAKFWPGEEALGKCLRLIEQHTREPWVTVVGVVPDILQNFRQNLERDPLIYLPYAERPEREVFLVARTQVPPANLADAFRREVQRIDENLPVYDVRTLENRIAEGRLTVSLFGAICSIFAGVATLLAAIGLYAVIAHAVSQRTQEIGLRMAIGASPRDVARLIFAQGIRPLAPGLAIGLLLALAASRLLRVALVGVSPSDPLTFVAIVVVLTVAALLGCLTPLRRALRVDPVVALRCN